MKNANNVYWQTDNKIPKICFKKGAEILPINLAWEKYRWTRKYFNKKPKQGYFLWIKKRPEGQLLTCVSIAKKNIKQGLQNLLVLEKGVKAKMRGTCGALKKNLCGIHRAKGKIILKENSALQYSHIHSWGEKDVVETNYEFFLEKNSRLEYKYKIFSAPKKLEIDTKINVLKDAAAEIILAGDCEKTEIKIKETLILKEKGASGIVKLRLVGRKNSRISARSRVLAEDEAKGHLDCQGLLLDDTSIISLSPKLICENRKAQLTHEASIGKISDEALYYLRMRGLSEDEAVNLIISGFLFYED